MTPPAPVSPPLRLRDVDPDEDGGYPGKQHVRSELDELRRRIRALQERLYAERQQALLIVLQAIDTGGKDGTVKHVFRGINPQGCSVWAFGRPSERELAHDFLWRVHARTPAKGMIGVFNRSHYEDVLVVRVKGTVPETVWRPRYEHINAFERMLADSGTTIVKLFLHISRAEQKRRLERRIERPDKRWKFDSRDLAERARWDDYQAAFEEAINHCTTAHAPWYVIPANNKWYRNLLVARVVAGTLERMNPQFPPPSDGLGGVAVPD
jgi:PPK2 family polyphosphate:nucleotide phosphotransferase